MIFRYDPGKGMTDSEAKVTEIWNIQKGDQRL